MGIFNITYLWSIAAPQQSIFNLPRLWRCITHEYINNSAYNWYIYDNLGFGLINSYITRSSLSGMTFTLIIFVITIQNFFLFRAFWSKAGTNDYDNSTKSFSSWYDLVNLSNYFVDRQFSSLLPSGPFVEAVACAISMAVAFNSVLGRIGLL